MRRGGGGGGGGGVRFVRGVVCFDGEVYLPWFYIKQNERKVSILSMKINNLNCEFHIPSTSSVSATVIATKIKHLCINCIIHALWRKKIF